MHYNPEYDNIGTALGHEDGLMVMGFFLQVFFLLCKCLKNPLEEKKGEITIETPIPYIFKSSPTNLE